MKPGELSWELRKSSSSDGYMGNRRRIVGLSLTALASMGVVSLYQIGIIHHLPEPPLPHFNADKVDASSEAYAKLQTPDAVLALVSYAVTAQLAAMGGKDRARKQPWIPLLLVAKLGFDTFQAGKLSVDQWTQHKAFCFWCLLAAAATFISAPTVIPETRAALHTLTSSRK